MHRARLRPIFASERIRDTEALQEFTGQMIGILETSARAVDVQNIVSRYAFGDSRESLAKVTDASLHGEPPLI